MYTDIMRAAAVLCLMAAATTTGLDAQRRGGTAAPPAAVRTETPKFTCPSVAGVGASTKRRYCDVTIAEIVEDGIRIEMPARAGAAILQFDLHNRFTVSGRALQPSRQDALAAIVGPDGKILDRAAVRAELRVEKDLFDRLTAAGGRGTIATAPGRPERIRVSVPAGVAFVALVGLRQDVQLRDRLDSYEQPKRPIALASNFEVSYTPRSR
jgi:hypothetical protein